MPLNIGHGKQSVTAAIHSKDNHLDNCAHWLDYACNFEVVGVQGNNFIGICKLNPTIEFKEC